jgi:hypothetical protein
MRALGEESYSFFGELGRGSRISGMGAFDSVFMLPSLDQGELYAWLSISPAQSQTPWTARQPSVPMRLMANSENSKRRMV